MSKFGSEYSVSTESFHLVICWLESVPSPADQFILCPSRKRAVYLLYSVLETQQNVREGLFVSRGIVGSVSLLMMLQSGVDWQMTFLHRGRLPDSDKHKCGILVARDPSVFLTPGSGFSSGAESSQARVPHGSVVLGGESKTRFTLHHLRHSGLCLSALTVYLLVGSIEAETVARFGTDHSTCKKVIYKPQQQALVHLS
jgi:hypothetical protein